MNLRTFSVAVFGLALATSALALSSQSDGARANNDAVRGTSIVSISWVPDWLSDTIGRAIADATDPRDRHK